MLAKRVGQKSSQSFLNDHLPRDAKRALGIVDGEAPKISQG